MRFNIELKTAQIDNGAWFFKKYRTVYRVLWTIDLTPDEQKSIRDYDLLKSVIYIEGGHDVASHVKSTYDNASDSVRAAIDRPIRWTLKTFVQAPDGYPTPMMTFFTPAEAREYEKKLRYDIFPKIEALLYNNRAFP